VQGPYPAGKPFCLRSELEEIPSGRDGELYRQSQTDEDRGIFGQAVDCRKGTFRQAPLFRKSLLLRRCKQSGITERTINPGGVQLRDSRFRELQSFEEVGGNFRLTSVH